MDEKLNKLEQILSLVESDKITYKEFEEVFAQFVKIVSELKEYYNLKFDDFRVKTEEVGRMVAQIDLRGFKDDIGSLKDSIKKVAYKDELKSMEKTLLHPYDIKPLDKRITTLEEEERFEKDTAEEIKDKLESLYGEDRLDVKAIKGIEDEMEKIRKIAKESKSVTLFGGGGSRGTVLRKHSLSSQCDGNNKAFSLPIDTRDVIGLFGSQFPIQFDPSGDWTFEGRTLTLGASVEAPKAGQTLWALIETL